MVPLERTLRKRGAEPLTQYNFPKLKPRPADARERELRLFKVVDVVSRKTLVEGVDARGAVDCLEDVRSIVDVSVFVWESEAERWRRLTFGETRSLWAYRNV